jgi:prepilin-type N-terminal cleavage/methylation domain-containing protein
VKQRGFSLLEVLLVLAVVGILAGLVAIGGRAILVSQQNRSALYSMRQIFWQGASAAASRGELLELVRTADVLEVRPLSTPTKIVRRVELSGDATLNLAAGQIATFSPSGKVTIPPANNPFTVQSQGKTYTFTVSLIGEVKFEGN